MGFVPGLTNNTRRPQVFPDDPGILRMAANSNFGPNLKQGVIFSPFAAAPLTTPHAPHKNLLRPSQSLTSPPIQIPRVAAALARLRRRPGDSPRRSPAFLAKSRQGIRRAAPLLSRPNRRSARYEIPHLLRPAGRRALFSVESSGGGMIHG